jgi:hypothetical protein
MKAGVDGTKAGVDVTKVDAVATLRIFLIRTGSAWQPSQD